MPRVSIIIPCYNEQSTIGLLLGALREQTFPLADLEVLVVDGLSDDGTRPAIAAFQAQYPEFAVQVIDNPQRTIPAAVNRGIAAATGEYIVRLDAHSMPQADYVTRCIVALEQGKGANVGGVWKIRPGGDGWIARSIAVAAAHPLGVGDARYRYADTAGPVDTVPFGAFRKDFIERIGKYDETLLTNEDYELNVRVRQAGEIVWLDPQIRSTYFARASLGALARQYWRYGYWKARMLRRYPESLRWRQALPPLFVLGLFGLAGLGIFSPFARWSLAAVLGVYGLVLLGAGLNIAIKRRDFSFSLGIPLAIGIMHLCWGSALLWSGIQTFFVKNHSI